MSEKLLPCPFCGSTNVHATDDGVGLTYVFCKGCMSEGPASAGNLSVRLWNTRIEVSDE